VRKVRRSMCVVSRRETDFSVVYQNVNPNLYSVWVCPHCGYAASDTVFAEVSPGEQEKLAKGLAELGYAGIDFSGERDLKKGIAAYERAIKCAAIRGAKSSLFAGLYLRLAWLLRSAQDPREKDYLRKALEAYEKAFNSEPMPIGKMSEVALTYLIGELYRRTGNPAKAVLWYSQVVSNPRARMEPQILQLARDGWQESREAAKARAREGEPPTAPADEGSGAAEDGSGTAQAGPKPVVSFISSQPAQPPAAPPQGPKPRAKMVSVITLYADQHEWLKKVSQATRVGKKRLDPQAIVRALLDSVIDIEPKLFKVGTEEELRDMFRNMRVGRGSGPVAAGTRVTARSTAKSDGATVIGGSP